jgi:hypothetical protein
VVLIANFTRAMEGRVVIICHLPSFVQRFFTPMKASLSKPQFSHLWSLVLAMVLTLRDAKLLHLSSLTPAAGHRTRRGAFLNHSQWDAPALIEQATFDLLSSMSPQAGETIYLLLDDTRIAKRGSRMDRLSKIWDHKQQKFVRGHIVLTAAVAFRGVVLPWRVRLWKPKGQPASAYAPRYRKLTDMAAALVRDFQPPRAGMKVRVLFDAFYLCPTVTHACQDKGFSFFSVAQRNRMFTTDNGKRRSLKNLMPGLLKHRGRNVRMKRSRGHAKLRIAGVDGHLSRIGQVRLVASKRPVAADSGHRHQRNKTRPASRRGDLRDTLADRSAVQRAAPGLGAGRLSDAGRGRDRPPPARLLPGPFAADPPVPHRTWCTSEEG